MTSIRPVIRLLALAYLRWALREMSPLHEDVPYVIHRIRHWEEA